MSDGITLRIARQDDISALDRLFRRSYSRLLKADYSPSVLTTVVPMIARAQPDLVISGHFYVVEEEGSAILGAGGWSLQPPGGLPATQGIGHIRHVATDPDTTRRGVARHILNHIVTVAREAGLSALHCQSTLTAKPFYEAVGFVTQGQTTLKLRGGIEFPAVQMVRLL